MRYSAMFAIMLFLGFIGNGIMHEQGHVAINNSYGIESKVYYLKYFPHFATVAEEPCPTEECKLAHNINEAIGYPLQIFYLIIGFAFLMIIILLEDHI